jgi:hypothetical protein
MPALALLGGAIGKFSGSKSWKRCVAGAGIGFVVGLVGKLALGKWLTQKFHAWRGKSAIASLESAWKDPSKVQEQAACLTKALHYCGAEDPRLAPMLSQVGKFEPDVQVDIVAMLPVGHAVREEVLHRLVDQNHFGAAMLHVMESTIGPDRKDKLKEYLGEKNKPIERLAAAVLLGFDDKEARAIIEGYAKTDDGVGKAAQAVLAAKKKKEEEERQHAALEAAAAAAESGAE